MTAMCLAGESSIACIGSVSWPYHSGGSISEAAGEIALAPGPDMRMTGICSCLLMLLSCDEPDLWRASRVTSLVRSITRALQARGKRRAQHLSTRKRLTVFVRDVV